MVALLVGLIRVDSPDGCRLKRCRLCARQAWPKGKEVAS